jgi:hypothetical protein
LSLNLGKIEVSPLLDDAAAIAQSAPRAAAHSFESASRLPEDDLFGPALTVARPVAPAAAPDELGRVMHTSPALDDALFVTDDAAWSAQAAAEPWAGLADNDVFRTPARATGLAGVLDDCVAEPIAAMAEPIVPFLGERLPPAREKGALPPTAALDRQAALRWVSSLPFS